MPVPDFCVGEARQTAAVLECALRAHLALAPLTADETQLGHVALRHVVGLRRTLESWEALGKAAAPPAARRTG